MFSGNFGRSSGGPNMFPNRGYDMYGGGPGFDMYGGGYGGGYGGLCLHSFWI